MIIHNVLLQPQGDKVILVAVLPASLFGKLPNQAYVIANTNKSIYSNMNPNIMLDMSQLTDAEVFCKMMETESIKGMGIGGIITSGIWFNQITSNPLAELIGETH